MSFFDPNCDLCGKSFSVGEKVKIITRGTVYMMDYVNNEPQARTTERRVLVCETTCV